FEIVEVFAVREAVLVVEGLGLLDLEPRVPREEEHLLGAAVALDRALPTDERAPLLPPRVALRIVGLLASALAPPLDARRMGHGLVARGEGADAEEEARPRHA